MSSIEREPLFDCYTSELMPSTNKETSTIMTYKSAPTDARVSQITNDTSSSSSFFTEVDVMTADQQRTQSGSNPRSQYVESAYRKRTLANKTIADNGDLLAGKRRRYSDETFTRLIEHETGSNSNHSHETGFVTSLGVQHRKEWKRQWGMKDSSSIYQSNGDYLTSLTHLNDSCLQTLRAVQARNASENVGIIQRKANEHFPDKPNKMCVDNSPNKNKLSYRSGFNDRIIPLSTSSQVWYVISC